MNERRGKTEHESNEGYFQGMMLEMETEMNHAIFTVMRRLGWTYENTLSEIHSHTGELLERISTPQTGEGDDTT